MRTAGKKEHKADNKVCAFPLLTNHFRKARTKAVRWIIITVSLAVDIFIKQGKVVSVTGLGVRAAANGRTNTVTAARTL